MIKNRWLNVVLLLTNRIYQKKQAIVGRVGLGAVFDIFSMIVLEIMLAFASLPLYVGMRPAGVTAYMSEKGTYERVSFDYRLRRVLTLTGVGIIALIWAVKLALIVALPSAYGNLPLYSVSPLRQADMAEQGAIAGDIAVQTARIIETMPTPEVTGVTKTKGGDYAFLGTGAPGSTVVLLLSDRQSTVYTADVDRSGGWRIEHSRNVFRLSEGSHSLIVYGYDRALGVRSPSAAEQFFNVSTTPWDALMNNVDVLANWSIVIVLLLGVFMTFLTM